MATLTQNVKKPWNKVGLIAIFSVLLAGVFVAVFFYRSNIKVPFGAFSGNDKYRAEAFVKKRQGLNSTSTKGSLAKTVNLRAAGISAKIAFDATDGKARLLISDKNGNPISRIVVVGTVTRVGKNRENRQFKMPEYGKGDFRSISLDLADGGWVLTVSAFDPYTFNKDKLVFYTERPIYVGRK